VCLYVCEKECVHLGFSRLKSTDCM